MSELGKELIKIWLIFVSVGLTLSLVLGILFRSIPFIELIPDSLIYWSILALAYIIFRRKRIRTKVYNQKFTKEEKEKLRKFKKEHPQEFKRINKEAKEHAKTVAKQMIKEQREERKRRRESLKALSKKVDKLSQVEEISQSGDGYRGIIALFRYIGKSWTKDEQEYLDRVRQGIADEEELIKSGRLTPSQIKYILRHRKKRYQIVAKQFQRKFGKEPPSYEELYGVS